jgi:16S rRNA (cytosine967-C5)-methyltransferase
LYATCSVFPEENGAQVDGFLLRHPEAERLSLPGLAQGDVRAAGIFEGQILPSAHSDGFFYALLRKTTA